jgi:hypothetical protein
MFEMEPYREQIKPTIFPPRLDVRSDKNINLDSDQELNQKLTAYEKLFQSVQANVEKSLGQKTVDPKVATNKAPAMDPALQRVMVNRAISKVYEGFGFLPQDILAKSDMTKNKFNYERVKDPNYVYLPDFIKSQQVADVDQVSFEKEIFEEGFFKLMEDVPGEGHTSPHNLNLMQGIGSNPFKDGDAENYMRFQKSPFYSALHTASMSPRNILQNLDPEIWATINQGIDEILDTDFAGMDLEKKLKLKNPFGAENPGLKWENVADPFADNNIDSFDIYANFHTVVSSGVWQFWDDTQVFNFVNRLWEARTRSDDVLREILGKASLLPNIRSVPEKATPIWNKTDESQDRAASAVVSSSFSAPKTVAQSEIAAKQAAALQTFDATEAGVLKHVDQWWDRVRGGFDEATVLPFGLLATFTPLMQTMMDWGNWGDRISSATGRATDGLGFKDKMINGYLNHTSNQYVFKKFKGDGLVTAEMLLSDSTQGSKNLWSDLVAAGYLDGQGRVTDKVDSSNPDFPLKLNVSEGDKIRIREVLRQASVGSFSMDVQDRTLVAGRRRNSIKIPSSDGQLRSLTEIVDLINKGANPYDRIKNSQLAYNSLFDLHATMVGLSDNNIVSGAALMSKSGTNVSVRVASSGEWTEWNATSNSWAKRQGPVSLQFHDAEALSEFKSQIRGLLALLEPAVGTFGPDTVKEGGLPFRMLIDNSGSMDTTEMITEGHENYRMQVDSLYDKDFFYTDSWKTIGKHLEGKAIGVIRDGMFGRGVANNMLRQAHTRKKDDYEEKKQEHEEREIQRMLTELKDRAERVREDKELEQKRREEAKRIENDAKKAANQRQGEEAAKRRGRA